MTVFAVLPISARDKLEKAIEAQMPEANKLLPNGSWLIAFDGTAVELSNKLGITPDGANGTGIVLAVASYYGRAPVDIWEWVKSRWEK